MKEFQLQTFIIREGKHFIIYSPELDLSTSGKNYEEAARRFNEIVEIFFKEIRKKGTTNEVLSSLGWSKSINRWVPPAIVYNEPQKFSIPIPV